MKGTALTISSAEEEMHLLSLMFSGGEGQSGRAPVVADAAGATQSIVVGSSVTLRMGQSSKRVLS